MVELLYSLIECFRHITISVPTCDHEAGGVSQAHAEVQHMLCCIAGSQLQSKGLPNCDEWRPAAFDLLSNSSISLRLIEI